MAGQVCDAPPGVCAEEFIPYDASERAVITTSGADPLFRYYNGSGGEILPSCPPIETVRRVDIIFEAHTGSGSFEEGEAREVIASAITIRIP